MKTISVLVLFLQIYLLSLVTGNKAEPLQMLLDCKEKVGARDEDIQMLKDRKLPTSYEGFCMITCLYEDAGIILDGKFQVSRFVEIIKSGEGSIGLGGNMAPRFIKEIAHDCKDVSNDDKCVLAKEIIMCASESVNKHLQKEL